MSLEPDVRSERGITIIETTVILSVLFILAGVMSPIVSESVTTARAIKAKNDASMIAMALINLQKDLGADAMSFGGVGVAAASNGLRLPGVLATEGAAPRTDGEDGETALASAVPMLDVFAKPGNGNGGDGSRGGRKQRRRKWLETNTESLDDHLMTNRKGYRYRKPGEYGGWNGPYVSAEIKSDPWGNQFLINSQWLDGGSTAADVNGVPRRAVFVVSPGANGIIETAFEQPMNDARPEGDDITIRIQ
jgi:type II secretory pathway pseudopilin PulG